VKAGTRIVLTATGHTAGYLTKGKDKLELDLIRGESIGDILDRLQVPRALFMFALVRDEKVGLDYKPEPGDEVMLVSPVMGG